MLCERIADLCRPIGRRETAQESLRGGASRLAERGRSCRGGPYQCARSAGSCGMQAGAIRPKRATPRRSVCWKTPMRRSSARISHRSAVASPFAWATMPEAVKWADEAIRLCGDVFDPRRARRSRSKRPGPLQRRLTPRVSPSPGSGATSRRCARSSAAWRSPKRPGCKA